jgi:hypothetical protein
MTTIEYKNETANKQPTPEKDKTNSRISREVETASGRIASAFSVPEGKSTPHVDTLDQADRITIGNTLAAIRDGDVRNVTLSKDKRTDMETGTEICVVRLSADRMNGPNAEAGYEYVLKYPPHGVGVRNPKTGQIAVKKLFVMPRTTAEKRGIALAGHRDRSARMKEEQLETLRTQKSMEGDNKNILNALENGDRSLLN